MGAEGGTVKGINGPPASILIGIVTSHFELFKAITTCSVMILTMDSMSGS